jgi:hypothetical protein
LRKAQPSVETTASPLKIPRFVQVFSAMKTRKESVGYQHHHRIAEITVMGYNWIM